MPGGVGPSSSSARKPGLVEDRSPPAETALSNFDAGALARPRRSRSSSRPTRRPCRQAPGSPPSRRRGEKPSSDPVTTMDSPSSGRGPSSTSSSSSRTPALAQLLDDRLVPVDVEPVAHGLADHRADPVDRGELLLRRRRGSRRSTGSARASACAAVGPTWRIDRATSTRHSGRVLAASMRVEQLAAVGRQPAVLEGEQLDPAQRLLVEVEDVALVLHDAGLQQADRGLEAEDVDVEGTAAGDVEEPLAQLGRARPVVGAADVGVALLLGLERRAAVGAARRHRRTRARCRRAASTTGPTISGMTSPALRSTTVSPISTPLRTHLGGVVQRRHARPWSR